MQNYIYDGKFSGNILVLGRTECGKTTFIQKLALNNFFGELKKAEWVSGISITKEIEAEIETNFSCKIELYYPDNKDELNDTIEELKLKSRSDESDNKTNVNVSGEKTIRDRLIVFDDVSGLADKSKNYNCVHIFHTLYPKNSIWQTILSQTNILNIFPATVSINSVKKILENACIQKTSKYIPQTFLWISRLFVELANRNNKVCLTLDCTNTKKEGPGRFRTEADNPVYQLCYFNSGNDEQVYNEFVSQRIKSDSSENNFRFKIVEIKSKTNKDISFNASEELRQLNKNDTQKSGSSSIFGRGRTSFCRRGKREVGLSGVSANWRGGLCNLDSTYSKKSITKKDGISRKRAKPEYLLEQ